MYKRRIVELKAQGVIDVKVLVDYPASLALPICQTFNISTLRLSLTFLSLLLGGCHARVDSLIARGSTYAGNLSASLRALLIHVIVVVVVFLVVVVVKNLASHQRHRALHQHFLVLGGRRQTHHIVLRRICARCAQVVDS